MNFLLYYFINDAFVLCQMISCNIQISSCNICASSCNICYVVWLVNQSVIDVIGRIISSNISCNI